LLFFAISYYFDIFGLHLYFAIERVTWNAVLLCVLRYWTPSGKNSKHFWRRKF